MELPNVALGTLDSFQHALNTTELDEHYNMPYLTTQSFTKVIQRR